MAKIQNITTTAPVNRNAMEYNDDGVPRWVERFYNGLWDILKVLLVIGFIAAIIFGHILFDKWYVNWRNKIMNLETLEKANRLAGTIEEINHAIECIGELLQHEEQNKDYKVVVRSEYHGKDFGGASVEAKYLYPELREALQKAQVRLRYEATELKKEFEAL